MCRVDVFISGVVFFTTVDIGAAKNNYDSEVTVTVAVEESYTNTVK